MNLLEYLTVDYQRIFDEYITSLLLIKYGDKIDLNSVSVERFPACTFTSWWYNVKVKYKLKGRKKSEERDFIVPMMQDGIFKLKGTYYVPRPQLQPKPLFRVSRRIDNSDIRVIYAWNNIRCEINETKNTITFMYRKGNELTLIERSVESFFENLYCTDSNCPRKDTCKIFTKENGDVDARIINQIMFVPFIKEVYKRWYPELEDHFCILQMIRYVMDDSKLAQEKFSDRRVVCFETWLRGLINSTKWNAKPLVSYDRLIVIPESNPHEIPSQHLKCESTLSKFTSIMFDDDMKYKVCPVTIPDQEPYKTLSLLPCVEVDEYGFLK